MILSEMFIELKWICWLFIFIPTVFTLPIDSPDISKNDSSSWEYQLRYGVSCVVIMTMVSTFFACICCRRQRRLKGFKDAEKNQPKEFKNGGSGETVVEKCMELQVPQFFSSTNQIQFEPLTVERFVPNVEVEGQPKSPSPSYFEDKENVKMDDDNLLCKEWFTPELHISRERLKYLSELGRGWFGKVVEGIQNFTNDDDVSSSKTRGIVVRILTEEASTKERAWFLNEALPYLKLHHKNILELIGTCLETDPYLLIFESCPTGDLKSFLISNKNYFDNMMKDNVPFRMALNIIFALMHMHQHGFTHTDLSARNCLVLNDLTIKLGDYGIGVDKYPDDYYVVGDRALPIRWSAPESLIFTDTTIETCPITPKANIWTFGILLWELINWGERPYNQLTDEQVIEMIQQSKFNDYFQLNDVKSSEIFINAIKLCLKLNETDRVTLDQLLSILKNDNNSDFDERWENLKVNTTESQEITVELTEKPDILCQTQPSFKLGPEEPLKNIPLSDNINIFHESGSETEEESWRSRVERGVYTEKVKQKSKSVADLMVLVHIDSDSEADWSLGSQIPVVEKSHKKRLPTTGSVGNLCDSLVIDEFDEIIRKLRNPINIIPTKPEVNHEKVEVVIENVPNELINIESCKNAVENSGIDDIDKLNSSVVSESIVLTSVSCDESQEEIEKGKKQFLEDEDEDRKHLSTPDDERSSDSGFRDKESCEEEENLLPTFLLTNSLSHDALPSTPLSASVEEELLKVFYELDTILDAEDNSNLDDKPTNLSIEYANTEIECNLTGNEMGKEKSPIHSNESTSINANLEMESLNDKIIEVMSNNANEGLIELRKENNNGDDEDDDNVSDNDDVSSTVSLRSDNSYVSFNLDEEFVAAIRNELREKLPHAQMSIVEAQELRDDTDEPIPKSWNDQEGDEEEDDEELQECDRNSIDIAIRYNTYSTPLSPILEERESIVTSESFGDTSVTSKLSALSEDVLIVDTQTNKAVLMKGTLNNQDEDDDDYDTSNENITDEENGEYSQSYQKNKLGQFNNVGVPMPSPEEETKWHAQFPIPLQFQDDLMSTSFSTDADWDSQDEEDEGRVNYSVPNDVADDDDEEDNSSSSGEFIWKKYDDTSAKEKQSICSRDSFVQMNCPEEKSQEENCQEEEEGEEEEEEEEGGEEEEEEFTPSAWDATLEPNRSAMRSPEKNIRTADPKKNVWFKKQRYHCVYEYPKETSMSENQGEIVTRWEPTSYSDWEEMIDIPRIDVYQMDYERANQGNEEFFVSSGSRPFQFQMGNGRYVSQFFPGASENSDIKELNDDTVEKIDQLDLNEQQQCQLGELRHTRDRLKLNLSLGNNLNTGNNNSLSFDGLEISEIIDDGDNNDDGSNLNEAFNDNSFLKQNDDNLNSQINKNNSDNKKLSNDNLLFIKGESGLMNLMIDNSQEIISSDNNVNTNADKSVVKSLNLIINSNESSSSILTSKN